MRFLAEAIVCLALARVKSASMPFRTLLAAGRVEGRRDDDIARKLAWAVRAASRRMPFRALCLEQAMALGAMLRRRGIEARVHYGAADNAAKGLHAHVWVTSGGTSLIGGEDADGFAQLLVWP